MKKLLFYLLVIFSLFSCSKDEPKKDEKKEVSLSFAKTELVKTYGDTDVKSPELKGKYDKEGAGKISYSSSDLTIATVTDKGVITIKKTGEVTIKAIQEESEKNKKAEATFKLKVNKRAIKITGLSNGLKKTYDGSIVPTPQGKPKLDNIVSGDDVSFADGYPKYSFADKKIGNDLPIKVEVKLKGTKADYYQVSPLTGLKQTLEAKQLTIKGLLNGDLKAYDGQASPKGKPVLDGIIKNDDVAFADGYPKYSFGDKKIGNDLPIKVEVKLKGTKADYYQVSPLTGLKQSVEVAVAFDSKTKSVTGLSAKYSSATKIHIPKTINGVDVDSIGVSAFQNNKTLKSVIIDDGTKYIGELAFASSNVENVSFPKTLVNIGHGTFYATKLKKIDLSNVKKLVLGNSVFRDCAELTEVKLSNSIEVISAESFSGCVKLTTINMPNSLKDISGQAFKGCVGLTNIDLSSNTNLSVLSGKAFEGCTNLKLVKLLSNISIIGADVFKGTKDVVVKIIFTNKNDIITSMYKFSNGTSFAGVKEIQVPKGKKAVLIKNAEWKKYEKKIKEY